MMCFMREIFFVSLIAFKLVVPYLLLSHFALLKLDITPKMTLVHNCCISFILSAKSDYLSCRCTNTFATA